MSAAAFDQRGAAQSDLALEAVDNAERLARAAVLMPTVVLALVMKGYCYYILGKIDDAFQAAEEAVAACGESDLRGRAMAQRLTSNLHRMRGEYGPAVSVGQSALLLWRQLGDRVNESRSLNELGEAALMYGDYGHARGLYEQALLVSTSAASRLTTQTNLAGVLVMVGEGVQALELVREVAESAPTGWTGRWAVHAYHAEALMLAGDADAAFLEASKAVQLASPGEVGVAWRTLGRASASHSREMEEARDAFESSVTSFEDSDAERARTLKAWAEAEVQYGDKAKADELWGQAKEIFETLNLELEVERMRLPCGQQPPKPY